MKPIIIKELKGYTKKNLTEKLKITISDLDEFIKYLIFNKFISIKNNKQISFNYVGIIIYKEKVLFVLPKYINDESLSLDKFKKILKLLKEYSKREKLDKEEIETIGLDLDNQYTNKLSLVTYILDDYIENGIYYNELITHEYNGEGEILWDKTVDNIDPFIVDKQVIYLDFITKLNVVNDDYIITNIHKFIINSCIEFMISTGLDLYLGYDLDKIDCDLDCLDDMEFILNKIEMEMQLQFNDKKNTTLRTMISFINNEASQSDESNIQLFGTRSFYVVWEKLCSYVFNNEFESSKNETKYDIFEINSPIWESSSSDEMSIDETGEISVNKNRLTPDILKTYKYNEEKYLLILDAKYYNIVFENKVVKYNPGIGDISKQYLYKLALDKYIKKNNINIIENMFLFPTDYEDTLMGYVSLDFMQPEITENNHHRDKIRLIKLNVEKLIELYCRKESMEISSLLNMVHN